MMDTTLVILLVAFDVTGAFLYALVDPTGRYVFPDDDDMEEERKRQSDIVNIGKFLFRVIGYAFFIFPWMLGLANIFQALKKARHYDKLRKDTEYLCYFIGAFLLSPDNSFKDKELDKELKRFEDLYNRYAVKFGVTHFDRFNPHEVEFTDKAKELFKKRVNLRLKNTDTKT